MTGFFHHFGKSMLWLSCLLCLLLLGGCRQKKVEIVIVPDVQKNHLQRNHIYGKVKEITTYTLVRSEEMLASDSLMTDSVKYDTVSVFVQQYSPDGYLLATYKLSPQFDTITERTFSYYPDARPKDWRERNYQDNSVVVCSYEYDMNDFLSAEKVFAGDSLQLTTTYKTDGAGNVIEMVRHYDNYSIRNTSHYNELGLLERIEEFEPSGNRYKYVTIEYDNYGDEVNRRAFKGENDLIEYTYTQYNQDGSLLKVLFEDRIHHSKEQYDYSEYDKAKNWTLETRTKDKKLIYKRIRNYIYY